MFPIAKTWPRRHIRFARWRSSLEEKRVYKQMKYATNNSYKHQYLTPYYLKDILSNTEAVGVDCPHLEPFKFRLITPNCKLYTASSEEAKAYPFPDPFWGFCWPGSYGLCRYLLERPDIIEKKYVLDFASGCGIASVFGIHLGSTLCIANDIDPWSCSASLLNVVENFPPEMHSKLYVQEENLVGKSLTDIETICQVEPSSPQNWVVLAGDVCYEEPLASQVIAWLEDLTKQGVKVLIGDPGRQYLPHERLKRVASYPLPPSLAQGNYGHPFGVVWSLQGSSS